MWGEGSMTSRGLTEAACHSGGVVKGQHGDKGMSSNWRNRPRPIEKSVEQVSRITGEPGKSAEGETAAARLAVATKRGNARGAKGPCCIRCLHQGEAGVR